MGWAGVELADIRSKLSVYINVLNVLNIQMIRPSQDNVERMLKAFMNEIRSGRRESSALSIVSTGSLSANEKEEWRQLRKELQSIGIPAETFSLNRDFIHTTLRALSQGEFENLVDLPTMDEASTPGTFFSPAPNTPKISSAYPKSSQDECQSSRGPIPPMKPISFPWHNDDGPFNRAISGYREGFLAGHSYPRHWTGVNSGVSKPANLSLSTTKTRCRANIEKLWDEWLYEYGLN
ncbi:uncharacterized protein N7496_007880 [Penicillium cataractarum]|uniref:Uncharacterized protein n=1 Tax=Penicillium cataractarum TaxID=2100454 RepID=A0A9W9RXJ0_9EURO|nr:uncharacterized protein N7496_007880 [Penicillium cataractarum]KAJ5368120.1 hypothetical protein N7496_007880 [Penicillium cataractarum]